LRAEGVDRIHHQAALHRDEAAQAGVAALELLHGEAVGDVVEAGQAVLVDGGAEQVELAHLGDQLDGEALVAMALDDQRHEARVDPRADGVAHQPLLSAEQRVDLHEVDAGETAHGLLLPDDPEVMVRIAAPPAAHRGAIRRAPNS
jgi:hypothetical protein